MSKKEATVSKASEKRQVLVFGGENLGEPSYTWFYSAITGGILHGHPGDEALLVTQEEAEALKKRLYADLPRNPQVWTEDEAARFQRFAGKKVIEHNHAQGYELRGQGKIRSRSVSVSEFVGV